MDHIPTAGSQATSSSEYDIRCQKLEKLIAAGMEPWAPTKPVTATCAQAVDAARVGSDQQLTLAGRLMTIRRHGKALFATVQDRSGRCQVYIKEDLVGDTLFQLFTTLIDTGDMVWLQGTPFITHAGEPTVRVSSWALLSKCLHPLPEKFHGISDVETKYRQRYLDLMSSPEVQERFRKRSAILAYIRQYLAQQDFMEVETPMLHPIPGGAAARPFVTHHNALDSDFYLRIAPELYLKRLVVGGFERVFEINRNFRNEGVSTRHNPEFTMIELYMAHQDYHFMMDFVQNLLKSVVEHTNGSAQVTYGAHTIDFAQPFARLSVDQALIKIGGHTADQLTSARIDQTLREYNVSVPATHEYGQKLFALFEETTEHKIVQPTFLVDFPIATSPLAKRDDTRPEIAARFELFIAGMEVANGFNELNDPFDQAARFKEQARAHAAGDEEAMHYDADYITALEYGLPPTVGVGIGIDRLVMLATNTTSIKEVILFPTLKRKES